MKKLLTFFLMALLAFGVGWADALTYTFSSMTAGTLAGEPSGVTASFTANANSYQSGQGVQLTKTKNTLTLTISGFTSSYKLTGITLNYCTNAKAGSGTVSATLGGNSVADDYLITAPSSNGNTLRDAVMTVTETAFNGSDLVLTVVASANSVYVNRFTVTYDENSVSSVTAPTFSPANGATFLSSQSVTLTADAGATIYYNYDSGSSWNVYSTPLNLTETKTVYAYAELNGETSNVVSATYTKTGVANIAEALAYPQNSAFTFTGTAVVTYQNGRNVWIRDYSRDDIGSGMIYLNNGDASSFNNGDILDANWTATNYMYGAIPEFTSPSGLSTSSNAGTVAPFDRTSTGITTANVNEYVSFSGIVPTYSNTEQYAFVTINGNKFYFRDYFNLGLTIVGGKNYDIEGIAYIYDGNAYVYMTKLKSNDPVLVATPTTLTINDSGTGNTFTVEGSNLGGDNVGLTQSGSYFVPTLTATTGGTYDGGTYWGFSPANGSVNGTVAMNYTGRDLSASETVTLGNNTGASATVDVNYRADVYILGNYGSSGWDYSNGILMTYDATNNTYTASVTAEVGDLIVFARKLGESNPWNTRILFGPNSNGDWWVNSSPNPKDGTIDLNDDDPIYFNCAGTYTIEINATTGALTVTREVVNTGDFELVTNVNDLNAGDEVIIVNKGTAGTARTMGQRNNNNYYGTEVTVTNALKVSATESTQIFTLEAGTGGWYFKTTDDLYLNNTNSGSSNYLQTKAKDGNGSNTSLAAITISSNAATIQFQGGGNKYLRYNANGITSNPNNNDIFSCYSSASSQQNVYIYHRTASTEPTLTVSDDELELVIPAGGSSKSGTVTVTESNTTGNTSVSINGDTNIFDATLNNGTLTVTYSGTASQANPDQATITLTNGTATATVTVTGYKMPLTVTITPADGHTFQGSTVTGLIESNVAGATIEYSFDGTNWETYDANEGFTATVNSVGGTVTVYARATYNGETATAQATYTRVPQSATCTADIVFAPTTDNGNISTWTGLKSHISEGADYVSDATVSTLITSTAYNAMRFGSGSAIGELDLTLDLTKFEGGACKLSRVVINAARYGNDTDCGLKVSTNVNTTGVTQAVTAGQTDFADYVFNFDGSEVTSISIANITVGKRVYVHSISLEYSCGASVEAPVITPASGTYYEGQTVEITAETGATIYYTTDGSDPTTSSSQYNGTFNVPYVAGGSTTVKAIAVIEQNGEQIISEVTEVTYTWGAPAVTISPATQNTTASSVTVTLTGTPNGATIYYTIDGSTPSAQNGTEYNGPFPVALEEIGNQVTVNAIAVYNGLTSDVASATYTRVEKMVEVNAPFFSPLQNNTYYGDQTLQIGCATPNADIYYEIVEVSGTTAPGTGDVNAPTKSSTYYDGSTINMTVGNSYYVKAIAYIGNYASIISEGWYIIEAAPTTQYTYTNLKDFNDNCPTGVTAHFVNPVQVVYHSTYTNNGEYAEFCYLRDNTDYACVYFGKRDTHDYTIFKMGDWIDGSQIAGVTNIWERNFHIQLGTGNHEVTSWPTTTLGWNEIIPEEITNDVIVAGTAEGSNSWGHYVHLRNTRLSGVTDYSESDPKHTGLINDGTADAYYYDKFYRWSAGTCTYDGHTDQIQCLGDYDQDFFTAKQNAGATFDVYGVIDYYSLYTPPFEMCPIDFLWAYNPEISLESGTYLSEQTVTISVDNPEWASEQPVIYYKTDDMEEWAEYTGPITVNSDTHIQAYAEVPAKKTDGTNYNDYVRSEIIEATYEFAGIEDPIITDHLDDPAADTFEDRVIEVGTVENVPVTVKGDNASSENTVTLYTIDGSDPRTSETAIAYGDEVVLTIDETTTIRAISYVVVDENTTLWSNEVTRTYTFVEKNSVIYDLLTQAPVVGNVYVIVNKDAYMGMSTTQNANNRGSVGVMFTDDTKNRVYGNEKLAQFVLEQATAGRYYFKNINGDNTGYLVVTTNANANLNTGAEATSYAEAAVSVENGNGYPATITFNYDGTTRYLRYYENGHTFSTYSDGTLNKEVYLYGLQATPLAYIESSIAPVNDINNITAEDKQVLVSDELIGVWAVVNPETGVNMLWAKDQGNVSIDKTSPVDGQTDYVKDILKLQNRDWDQSNWVALDFSGTGASAYDYESKKLKSMTVEGYYYDDLNYAIKLTHVPEKVDNNNVEGYPGYNGDYLESAGTYYYNHYTPVNFMTDSLNAPYGNGAHAGHASTLEGMPLFFMNPKIQEVAQVWGVWMGNDRFDVINKGTDSQNNTVNGLDLSGSFVVKTWDYNRLSGESYGCPITDENPNALEVGQPYLFHVIITRNNYDYGHVRGTGATPDGSFGIMPADLPSGHPDPTAVKEVTGGKTVESVRYYNIMGQESPQPFEGINIVVTRYSDGTMSAVKVLR